MDADRLSAAVGGLAVQRVVERYPLEPGLSVTLTPDADAWRATIESDPAPAGLPADPRGADPSYGADALAHLLRYDRVPSVPRFSLVRHAPTPEASGERPVDDDGQVVVVGERVVVSWARTVRDLPYTAPVTLAQLAAVDFLGVPVTHGLLIWTTPSGHEAPVAVITKYLPRATDGRHSLVTMLGKGLEVEPAETPALSSRMGRIAGALHVALATRSSVLADPVRSATTGEVTDWHERIRSTIDRAGLIAAEAADNGSALGQAFLARLGRLEADADALLRVADDGLPVLVQRVHGDLHAGRILRWAGGLMITGFGDEPERDTVGVGRQPAARDLAGLLHSLTEVARQVDGDRPPGDPGGAAGSAMGSATETWLPAARQRLLDAYRAELTVARRQELLDERLLAGFEAEHAAREVIETAHREAEAASAAAEAVQAFEAGRAAVWEQSVDRPW
jgi:maltokinase